MKPSHADSPRRGVKALRLSLLFLSCVVLLLLAQPVAANETEEDATFTATVPNPAAHYCLLHGYPYDIVDMPSGQSGTCTLPDGRSVDAWAFYRGEVGAEYATLPRWTPEPVAFNTTTELSGDERRGGPAANLPSHLDWRDQGACTPIRDQADCNACWAFATIGVLESAILIKDGVETDLSEQWLVSCNNDGWGCQGGSPAHKYVLWKNDPCGGTGAILETSLPYGADDLPCNCPYRHDYQIDDWGYVGASHEVPDTDAIKQSIYKYGPICVGIAADQAFASYTGGIFEECESTGINHYVILVGWDDTQGEEGVWILRNCWGTGWGEDGYMRIAYGCNRVGYAASWLEYAGTTKIDISFPRGRPSVLGHDHGTSFIVRLDELNDELVQGSAHMWHRRQNGVFESVALEPINAQHYRAMFPAPTCNDLIEYYLSVKGSVTGTICNPAKGPDEWYTVPVGALTTLMEDDFESDQGWTVENSQSLIAGAWERGVPVGGGDLGDPATDHDGSGNCYLTGNADGNSDVDLGTTWLTSPPIDVSGCDRVRVSYAVWYTNRVGNDPFNDIFKVAVSPGGLEWTTVDPIGPHSRFGWDERSFMLEDYIELSGSVRVRFEASDLNDISIVEAGLDAFTVERIDCGSASAPAAGPTLQRSTLMTSRPNPFSSVSTLDYQIAQSGPVRLDVYGVDGRHVRALASAAWQEVGLHRVSWDGRDDLTQRVSAGIYYYRLRAADGLSTRQVLVLE